MSDHKAPRTMSDMIKERKDLIKRRAACPELKEIIDSQVDVINQKLMSRVNKNDQNFLRVFYKTAKEILDPDVSDRIENVASTRRHHHESQGTSCNK